MHVWLQFWVDFGGQVGAKINAKTSPKIGRLFSGLLDLFGEPEWSPDGPEVAPKSDHFWVPFLHVSGTLS